MKCSMFAGVLCLGIAVLAQDVQFDYDRLANVHQHSLMAGRGSGC